MDCILSAAYQKDRARRMAFHQWELEYHLARARNDLQVEATGTPLDGAAYQYVISQPPSEVNHPLWSAVVAMEKDEQGRKTQPRGWWDQNPEPHVGGGGVGRWPDKKI
jgi:hypothetical protein